MKNLQELPKLRDSITYLYLEHAVIEQNDTAIVAIQKDGRIPIPIAAMTCLLLGSGNKCDPCGDSCNLRKWMYGDLVRRGSHPILCGRHWRDQKRKESALPGEGMHG